METFIYGIQCCFIGSVVLKVTVYLILYKDILYLYIYIKYFNLIYAHWMIYEVAVITSFILLRNINKHISPQHFQLDDNPLKLF